MQPPRAKKRLGQNFLQDTDIARQIALQTVADLDPSIPIVEVGGGRGALTCHLLALPHTLRVIEFDNACFDFLQTHFPALKGAIIQADFLKFNLQTLFPDQPFAVIGNYPYNISSQIVIKIIQNKDSIPLFAGMFQEEVARRLASPPAGRTRGILSVLLQAWYDAEYLFTVPPTAFVPQPKVQSGVVRFTRNSRTALGCDENLFVQIIKTTFNQRRKMLRHTLRPLLPQTPSAALFLQSPHLTRRPEQLNVDEFIELTNQVVTLRTTND